MMGLKELVLSCICAIGYGFRRMARWKMLFGEDCRKTGAVDIGGVLLGQETDHR